MSNVAIAKTSPTVLDTVGRAHRIKTGKAMREGVRRSERVGESRRFVDEVPIVYHVTLGEDKFFDVHELFMRYRESLSANVQLLFSRYRMVDWVVKVAGVGSVGLAALLPSF